jgi:hypothetical protein
MFGEIKCFLSSVPNFTLKITLVLLVSNHLTKGNSLLPYSQRARLDKAGILTKVIWRDGEAVQYQSETA